MPSSTIPTTLADITPAMMTDGLRANGFADADVASIEVERIAVGEGFLGELARLHLTYGTGAGPATAIGKIPTTDSGLKPIGDLLDVYNREHRAYAEIIPQLKVRTPRAWLNLGNAETGAYCLVLEDVGHLAAGDHHAGGTLAQARAAVTAAAGVHSRWWNKVDALEWVPPIDSPLNMGLQGMVEASWPMVVDRYGEILGADVIAHLENFIPTMSEMLVAYGPVSNTLVHNDFRLDNMFFDGDELLLIDWQVVGRGDGMGDIAPFLSCNLDVDLRREHEADLFGLYHRLMSEAGAGYVDFDDLITSYRLSLNFWLANWCNTAATKGETTQRGEELFERMLTRNVDAYREHEAWEMIGVTDLAAPRY
ncbi:MAG: phosphotransferase [Actinomycetota bacterium]